ncbi:Coenzyme F420 hydrogenase/dehydrogenase, beta subunit C-terminal domain [Timonella senegalensis]|uniref:Coenzyme F420 hydrogenase/dehydrogenase, beta subunit C-terminal domain n=1 Tax=Timonella senegalensis TaxID=1465825 RepID=UPI002FDDE7DD
MTSGNQVELTLAKITSVVENDQCSGCGACAALFPTLGMELDRSGFLRPDLSRIGELGDLDDSNLLEKFENICPGLQVEMPPVVNNVHPVFGTYVSSWVAWATDGEVRSKGSSGGVITALNDWMLSTGKVTSVSAVQSDSSAPTRAVPVVISRKEDVLGSAGSRYQPVASCTGDANVGAFTGKPCEVYAQKKLDQSTGIERASYMSFFCAGTPSQRATDKLIGELGGTVESTRELKYRGDGWPGNFVIKDEGGTERSRSYHDSWGAVLGRDLQYRCKVCVDGTGEHADIAVGDFWHADERGYPLFEDAEGRSVVLARTQRGDDLLRRAVEAGVIEGEPLTSLDELNGVQPLQVARRNTLWGRLLGRRLAGYRVPQYPDYSLSKLALKSPIANARAAAGSFLRSRKERLGGK